MPAEAVHLTALNEALALEGTDPALRRLVRDNESAARLGAVLVDLPYFQRFPEQVVRYVLGRTPRHAPWGVRLHEEGPIDLLAALVGEARARRDDGLAALAVGLASHAALDRMLHPLVNALARENGMRRGMTRMSAHMEVEKYQSICFHEVYHGRDLMGTRILERAIRLLWAERLERSPAGPPLERALGTAFGASPGLPALGAWGRGYRSYTRLLGSPLGRTIAPERKKAHARPIFLEGPWGDFASLLEEATRRSVPVMEATLAACVADDRDADAALAALLAILPPGTIDDPGDGVRLDEAYAVSRFV